MDSNIRELVYSAEFKTEIKDTKITIFMISAAIGSPAIVKMFAYGAAKLVASFHGKIKTINVTEPTKNNARRNTTLRMALTIFLAGFSDSAAAIAATSAPQMEKITNTIAVKIGTNP